MEVNCSLFQLDFTSMTIALFLSRSNLHNGILVRILHDYLGVKISSYYKLIKSHLTGDVCLSKALWPLCFST